MNKVSVRVHSREEEQRCTCHSDIKGFRRGPNGNLAGQNWNGQGMCLAFLLFFLLTSANGMPRRIPIGGLFDDDEMTQRAFELSVKAVNKKIMTPNQMGDTILVGRPELVDKDLFHVARRACKLAGNGVAGILGPQDIGSGSYVKSMCDIMEIPYITVNWEPEPRRGNAINLYPHAATLSTVYENLVDELKWKGFAILYENVDGLLRMSRLLQLRNVKDQAISLYRLGTGPNFRKLLQEVKSSFVLNLVIDCSLDKIPDVLEQCLQVGLMTEQHSIIVASLDLQTVDLEPYQYSGVNLTGVRLIDPESPIVESVLASRHLNWRTRRADRLRVGPALVYDAVQLFAIAYTRLRQVADGTLKRLFCNETEAWEHGQSLTNFMRAEVTRGLTGPIKFDIDGFRSDFHLDIVSLGGEGLRKIGEWNRRTGIEWSPKAQPPAPSSVKSLQDKHFLVLISLTDPFGMLRESADIMTGNERYEGFAIDIIQEMSKLLGFNYTFQVESVYGNYHKDTGKWDGMIGKLMNDEADLAITDLTITAEREGAVDFTTPFMNLGISVLYRKPTKIPPSVFSFLHPFSHEVWLYLTLAYMLVTLVLFVIGRLCPVEWTNPYPCVKEPEVLENPYTMQDTPLFVVGSLINGSTDFAPAGISTRTLAAVWWFFCLIIYTTYTANLAAALSTKSVVWPFKTAEELADQTKIKYGAKRLGSTVAFFRSSTHPPYEKMHRYMNEHAADVLPISNEAALEKVQQENYAYFMESTSIAYYKQRICNVTQVGGLLDAKGYGIAMKKNVPYRHQLSGAILKLKESGMINELVDRWWKQKRGGDKCEEKEEVKVEPLNFEDVGGVFLILMVGVMVSWVFTGFSFLWNVRNVARERNVPLMDEIVEELKFLATCSGTKVVKGR